MKSTATLLAEPSDGSQALAQLSEGDVMRVLDNSRGWAWGYGPGGEVGYVSSTAIAG